MKKIVILSFVVVFLLSGCWLGKKQAADKQPKAKKAGIPVKEASLMNWLKNAKSVTCEIETPDGNVMVMSKDKKVRMEGIMMADSEEPGKTAKGYSITDGDWMYTWSGKKGTKMNLKKLNEFNKDSQAPQEEKSWEEEVAGWEKSNVKYKCQETNLPDSKFVPPADVEFTDLTAMLSNMAEIGQQFQQKNSQGTNPPDMSNIDLEAIKKQAEEMQKKYGE